MGKPDIRKSKKDSFFVNKKKYGQLKPTSHTEKYTKYQDRDDNSSRPGTDSAGSFFVTPSEKQQILQQRESKKNDKFKPGTSSKSRDNPEHDNVKKPFDKKKYRLQKYSKKYKLEQWEEKRKKAVLHQYYKHVKDDGPKLDVQKIYKDYKDSDEEQEEEVSSKQEQEEIENENNLNKSIVEELTDNPINESHTSQSRKKKAHKRANQEYQRIQNEKQQKKQDLERKKSERAEALAKYKKENLEKYKKLNKKTKKGQPIMKHRMEMLLEQIQKAVN